MAWNEEDKGEVGVDDYRPVWIPTRVWTSLEERHVHGGHLRQGCWFVKKETKERD